MKIIDLEACAGQCQSIRNTEMFVVPAAMTDKQPLPVVLVEAMEDFASLFQQYAATERRDQNKACLLRYDEEGWFGFVQGGVLYCTANYEFLTLKDLSAALHDQGFPVGKKIERNHNYAEALSKDLNRMAPEVTGKDFYQCRKYGLSSFIQFVAYVEGKFYAHRRQNRYFFGRDTPPQGESCDQCQFLARDVQYKDTPLADFLSARELGFTHRWAFEDARELGLRDHAEMAQYIRGGFHAIKVGHNPSWLKYKADEVPVAKFREAATLGLSRDDCDHATQVGFGRLAEYKQYKEGGFQSVQEFREGISGGFTSRENYMKAKALGFTQAQEYELFLASGCQTRAEYVQQAILPAFLKKCEKITAASWAEAETHYTQGNAELFVQKAYNAVEKQVEKVAALLAKERPQNSGDLLEEQVEEIRTRFEEATFPTREEVSFWRRLRNKLVHESYKMGRDPKELERAKFFFDEIFTALGQVEAKVRLALRNNILADPPVKKIETKYPKLARKSNTSSAKTLQKHKKTLEMRIMTENLTLDEEKQIIAEIGDLEKKRDDTNEGSDDDPD